MKRGVMAAFLLLTLSSGAWAGVLNFDTLSNGPIPTNYGGFVWSSHFYVTDQTSFQSGWGNTYGFPSAPMAAFNGFGDLSVSVMGGGVFDFNGAYFSSWALNNGPWPEGSSTITVNGYNGVNLLGSANMSLPYDSFAWLNANFNGIDRLEFLSDGSARWWLMDNFTYNQSVPEPTSLLLLGIGFGVVGLASRRKKV